MATLSGLSKGTHGGFRQLHGQFFPDSTERHIDMAEKVGWATFVSVLMCLFCVCIYAWLCMTGMLLLRHECEWLAWMCWAGELPEMTPHCCLMSAMVGVVSTNKITRIVLNRINKLRNSLIELKWYLHCISRVHLMVPCDIQLESFPWDENTCRARIRQGKSYYYY